jgi:hypothetical protein
MGVHTSIHKGSLAAFQTALASALRQPGDAVHPSIATLVGQPGFAVYRNTVAKGCVDAIVGNFPSVMNVVGEEWLRAAALRYVRAHPPGDPRLLLYGKSFPVFLRAFEPAQELPYLADIAQIDRWWSEAHVADDAVPLAGDALASIPSSELGSVVLKLHPSARWQWFAEFPAHSLWRLNRDAADEAAIEAVEWTGEGVLLVRPHGGVNSMAIGPGACSFLDACREGRPLSDAATAACRAEPSIDLSLLMKTLIEAGAFAGPITNERD